VREVQNVIERAVVLAAGPAILPAHLPADLRPPPPSSPGAGAPTPAIDESLPLAVAVDDFKRARIRHALAAAAGNQTQAAQRLGLRQSNLSRLMRTLGIR
jgi:DNA-binding NtrC family response regulator